MRELNQTEIKNVNGGLIMPPLPRPSRIAVALAKAAVKEIKRRLSTPKTPTL